MKQESENRNTSFPYLYRKPNNIIMTSIKIVSALYNVNRDEIEILQYSYAKIYIYSIYILLYIIFFVILTILGFSKFQIPNFLYK